MPSVYVPGQKRPHHFTPHQAMSVLDQLIQWQRREAVDGIAVKEEKERMTERVRPEVHQ